MFVSSLCLAKWCVSSSFVLHPSFQLCPLFGTQTMLQVSLFRRISSLVDLLALGRHSQNIRGYRLKKAIIPFACVIVTQVVIFGVNYSLNPVAIKIKTQPSRRVTSDASCLVFCPQAPIRGWRGEGQPQFEPPALGWVSLLLQFMLCYNSPAVPAMKFRVAPWYEQMSTKTRQLILSGRKV